MNAGISDEARSFIRSLFAGDCSGHDYWHSIRVYENTARICDTEPNADRSAVTLAALLHDADDRKLGGDWVNMPNAVGFLRSHEVPEDRISFIVHIISQVSFKGKDTETPDTIEGQVLQDADRLDAIGAIGIARAFAYGGSRGRPIYDPNNIPRGDMSEAEYFSGTPDSIAHFHEKLLLLKDMMNTAEGKRIAERRHSFMKAFLAEFDSEWCGND